MEAFGRLSKAKTSDRAIQANLVRRMREGRIGNRREAEALTAESWEAEAAGPAAADPGDLETEGGDV